MDATDPTDRALAFAITGRVRNMLMDLHDENGLTRSRRSSATSTSSRSTRRDSVDGLRMYVSYYYPRTLSQTSHTDTPMLNRSPVERKTSFNSTENVIDLSPTAEYDAQVADIGTSSATSAAQAV